MKMKYPSVFLAAVWLTAAGPGLSAQPVPYLAKDGTYQFVDKATGRAVDGRHYELARPFSDGLALVVLDHRTRFIREDGSEAFAIGEGEASSFRDGVSVVTAGKACYIMDKTGHKEPVGFRVAGWTLAGGYAAVQEGPDAWGYMDIATRTRKIPAIYQFARPFSDGLAAVRTGGKWGFIDGAGRTVIRPVYDHADEFGDGLAPVSLGGKWGFVNRQGTLAIPIQYDRVTPFEHGYAFVRQGENTWVAIDAHGAAHGTVACQMMTGLSEGLAGIMVNGYWGFADASGKVVIAPAYTLVSSFDHGLAMAVRDGRQFYIDKTGREFRAR